MAVTLGHVAKLTKEPLAAGIIMNILRYGRALEYLSFENVNSLSNIAIRWTNLPDVAFRKINAGYTASEGDVEQITESVYGFGSEIELDRVWKKVQGSLIQDPKLLQIEMTTKSMGYKFMDYLVNGDHATDVDGFEGLKKRISNMPARQTVNVTTAAGTALDPTASAANARLFLDRWEKAYARANGGDVSFILLNEDLMWGYGRVLRYLGTSAGYNLLDVTKDSFDREILTYKGAPMVESGLKKDQSTEIITNTEIAADAGADATTAYFVPVNMENGIMGIQLDNMEVYDPLNGGEQEATPTNMVRIEWWAGLSGWGSYGPTKLWNIEDPNLWT